MQIQVRLSAALSQYTGRPRLQVTLTEGATIADLVAHLATQFPALHGHLDHAVPFVAGRHAGPTDTLAPEQEVLLLVPIAGG